MFPFLCCNVPQVINVVVNVFFLFFNYFLKFSDSIMVAKRKLEDINSQIWIQIMVVNGTRDWHIKVYASLAFVLHQFIL